MAFSSLENCITEVEKSLVYFKHHMFFLWEKSDESSLDQTPHMALHVQAANQLQLLTMLH